MLAPAPDTRVSSLLTDLSNDLDPRSEESTSSRTRARTHTLLSALAERRTQEVWQTELLYLLPLHTHIQVLLPTTRYGTRHGWVQPQLLLVRGWPQPLFAATNYGAMRPIAMLLQQRAWAARADPYLPLYRNGSNKLCLTFYSRRSKNRLIVTSSAHLPPQATSQ